MQKASISYISNKDRYFFIFYYYGNISRDSYGKRQREQREPRSAKTIANTTEQKNKEKTLKLR